jgi:two-component system sensor histidine kinase KdpD
VGVIISYLTLRVQRESETARKRERQTAALFALGRDLAVTNDLESYINAITKRARETFGHEAAILLPDQRNKETLKLYSGAPQGAAIDENELAAAIWSYRHQKMVGHGTDTLPNAKARYLPLVTTRGAVGVISISAIDSSTELTIEQERLLEAYADLAALAIESISSSREPHK